jgi:hypothetical protein
MFFSQLKPAFMDSDLLENIWCALIYWIKESKTFDELGT